MASRDELPPINFVNHRHFSINYPKLRPIETEKDNQRLGRISKVNSRLIGWLAWPMKKNLFNFPALMLVIDSGVIVLAWAAAFYLRVSLNDQIAAPIAGRAFVLAVCLLLPVWLITFGAIGLYRPEVYRRKLVEASRLALGSFIGILLMVGVDFMSNQGLFAGRLVVVYGFVLLLALLIVGRAVSRALRRVMFRWGIGVERVVVAGRGPATVDLVDELLAAAPRLGYRLVAVAGTGPAIKRRLPPGVVYYPNWRRLPWGNLRPDSLILTDPYQGQPEPRQLVEEALKNYVTIRLVPTDGDMLQGVVRLDLFAAWPVLTITPTALSGFGLVAKRLFDVGLASIVLIASSPLLLPLMIVIKLTSPRDPVIFRHQRLTRFEQPVTIYKLRTMHQRYSSQNPADGLKNAGRPDLAAEVDRLGPQPAGDPRVTRLGRWLRRYSIDELPQLINVLRGDISLVGPRSLPRRELAGFERYIPILLSVKTGLTGLAQVSGRSNLTPQQKVQFNIYYIQNWSLWLDFTILIKTVNQVLRRQDVNV